MRRRLGRRFPLPQEASQSSSIASWNYNIVLAEFVQQQDAGSPFRRRRGGTGIRHQIRRFEILQVALAQGGIHVHGGVMRFQSFLSALCVIVCACCLSSCGATRGLQNTGSGLAKTAWNLPKNLLGTANTIGKGLTQGAMSHGRSVMGMGPRVLSVPAQ